MEDSIDIAGFIRDNANIFPFDEVVMVTRNKVYLRWIMIDKGGPFDELHDYRFLTVATTDLSEGMLYHEEAEKMIVSKKAIPLTSDMCEIMDFIFHFAEPDDLFWSIQTKRRLAYLLKARERVPRKDLFFEILHYRVFKFNKPSWASEFRNRLYDKTKSFGKIANETESLIWESERMHFPGRLWLLDGYYD